MEGPFRIEDIIKEEKLRNIFNQVFDHRVVEAIHKLANDGYIDHLEHIISTGKEAHVYKAVDKAGNAKAVKIYKIETSYFRNMRAYIEGDLRFKHIGHDKQDIIYQWTRKEYKNLEKFIEAEVRVPMPHAFNLNVLVMEFIGNEHAAPLLKEAPIADLDFLYSDIVEQLAKMIYKAKLVHADLSEYNILNFHNEPVIIDCGQAVLLSHPNAKQFFERDLQNLTNYFTKQGLEKTPDEMKADIKALKSKV
jgi:RIO kinase 1